MYQQPAPADTSSLRLSTHLLRPHERVDYWREMICRHFAEVEVASRLGSDFHGEMETHQYGALRLTAVSAKAQSVNRFARDARDASQDCYFAVLLTAGSQYVEQDGRQARLLPGNLVIYDAARPHRLIFPEDFRKLILQIPRDLMEMHGAGMRHATARAIETHSGAAALAGNFLRSIAGAAQVLDQPGRVALSQRMLGLLASALEGRAPQPSLMGSRSQSLARIKSFIDAHLADPALDSASVAAAVGLSPRYVNQLFEQEGTSLMRYVLRQRLERCRSELLAFPQSGRLYDTALRWGFNDPSHFSRAFRKHFGVAPRSLRADDPAPRP